MGLHLCCRKASLWFHFSFPVSRVWTSLGSPHTCLLGFASFSCSPFHSSDYFTGTKSCITRNPVRLLVSGSTSSYSPRVYCHDTIFSGGSCHENLRGYSPVKYQGSISRWDAAHQHVPVCLLVRSVLSGALNP